MDVYNRVKQIIDLGLPVYRGTLFEKSRGCHSSGAVRVAGVWENGSIELVYGFESSANGTTRDIRRHYQTGLRAALRAGGIDPDSITDKIPTMELHVLTVKEDETYEFFLPSHAYFESRNQKKYKV